MKRFNTFILVLILTAFSSAQTLEDKLKEIDDYANTVMAT